MALTSRSDIVAIVVAAGVAVAFPVALLPAWRAVPAAKPAPPSAPLTAGDMPPALAALYERPLFGNAREEAGETPADAPQLVGIAGRLGADAVALVRIGDGATRTLRIGESVDGWQLVSLAIDAAFFTRGTQRVRVPLPTG